MPKATLDQLLQKHDALRTARADADVPEKEIISRLVVELNDADFLEKLDRLSLMIDLLPEALPKQNLRQGIVMVVQGKQLTERRAAELAADSKA